MLGKGLIKDRLPLLTFALALVLFIMSLAWNNTGGNTERMAKIVTSRIESRMEALDGYISEVLCSDRNDHRCAVDLPEDMVIYKYVNDSLKSWSNQFSVLNDDISNKLVFQRLTNLKNRIVSPLTNVTEELSYLNLGPKWYLVKVVEGQRNDKIIAGIEIKNALIDDIRRNDNGVNPNLRLPGKYTILPLNYSGGSTVSIQDKPMFKILCDSASSGQIFDNSLLRWVGLALFALSLVLFLASNRTARTYVVVLCMLTVLFFTAFYYGIQMTGNVELFSPTTYANGPVLFSLGALLLLNTYISLAVVCSYLMNDTFINVVRADRKRRKRNLKVYFGVLCLLTLLLACYIHITLKSLLLNSNISLELYRWNTDVINTLSAYVSYIGLMFCIILHFKMMRPVIRELYGRDFDILSARNMTICALCAAAYFSVSAGVLGFRREKERVSVWANRLAVDRDLGLEIRLKAVEESIAEDQIISSLSELERAEGMILNRISETYLARIRQDYSISILLLRDDTPWLVSQYNEAVKVGIPIAEGSHFMFVSDGIGHNRYVGTFLFYSHKKGLARMLLTIEPNSNRDDRGYFSIIGKFSAPGDINIPYIYSYAKYSSGRLISYKGNYPYPTTDSYTETDGTSGEYMKRDKSHIHFLYQVGEDEVVIISRPKRNGMVFFTSFSYLFLMILALTLLFARTQRRRKSLRSNYFKTRINTILFTSSTLILTSLTIVSVFFVYKRNEQNMRSLMSTKINTIQALVGTHTKSARSYDDLLNPAFRAAIENISSTTKSDITLYTPDGKVFYSTTPEVFDKMVLGNRIDKDAFHNICHMNQRYYINQENIADFAYWVLYAPIFNSDREMVAIASSPYTEGDYDFRHEAFFHAAMLVNLFLLLLIISLLFSTKEVDQMFAPLAEMGKKMNTADIHNLEPIIYNREDEISALVEAYNRMVKELSDSTVRLAQAERDKAWSQMARQVAHEIKNPLTPIKLEIQRLIRLKEKGNPKWEEKFDTVSSVILEHIDILTDTANEFSTFAKLYSEEPVLVDLVKTLKDQMLIFDNKENIDIQYIGLDEAYAMAPRPQLIRVFVNLITNAIQAVEIMQKEAVEKGEDIPQGRVLICLRNSTADGCYDIVVDDNGPGVKEENLSRLFTPNFTTKSGGTGLGLAICRNIIEKCNGSISYSRSFGLGGASFTITLPKHSV